MSNVVTDSMRDPGTPDDVVVTVTAREPVTDPTLGIAVAAAGADAAVPPNRLVTIGDSLTQGFQSGAVFHTDLSWPAIVAWELGWYGQFRKPVYGGPGGLPLNIELLLRDLEHRFGADLDWWEFPLALFQGRQFMDSVEDNGQHAAMYVLPSVPRRTQSLTPLGAAADLGGQGGQDADGIETLVIMLGANNALGSVTGLKVVKSAAGYDDLRRKDQYSVWRPTHFEAELGQLAAEVRKIKARHVIWSTVPHVTIAPIARGLGGKVAPGSRYFPYYTRPWIDERRFDAHRDPNITAAQARAVDSAIDQYNDAIVEVVRAARNDGRDWYVLDVAGLLDRLAARRYLDDPLARPPWWTPYELPTALRLLSPVPDSRFLLGGPRGRISGGLFSLDGVHPTTVAYGILAQEIINIMQLAGVRFFSQNGQVERTRPVRVDFERLVRLDTLITSPPALLTTGLGVLGWADQALDAIKLALP